jgi:hypothetical protein
VRLVDDYLNAISTKFQAAARKNHGIQVFDPDEYFGILDAVVMTYPSAVGGPCQLLASPSATLPAAFVSHYRCMPDAAAVSVAGDLTRQPEFFSFGPTICYGRHADAGLSRGRTVDVLRLVKCAPGRLELPFDLSEVIANLQYERYQQTKRLLATFTGADTTRKLYYVLRPFLTVAIRKHVQKLSLRGWDDIGFPHWPVDSTVETLMEDTMRLVLDQAGVRSMPFVWFWPDGAPSCAIMTHDVEHLEGRDFCDALMDLDDEYGIKASFQIVPEDRYDVTEAFLERIRRRGFEINVHDLNHDGQLFRDRQQFAERAARINEWRRRFQSHGFRTGIMYRRQEWFDVLEFCYDMSVPNVAHLEPQRGGCCTVMPHFLGKLVELPLTTIQDYSLFHILGDYSIDLWKQQIELIHARHGLMSFIAHPDYLVERRARRVYCDLLAHLRSLGRNEHVWLATPRDVAEWWRNRSQMTLAYADGRWHVEGPDAGRAVVAHAMIQDGRLSYRLDTSR